MFYFINVLFSPDVGGAVVNKPNPFLNTIPLVLVFLVFYFLAIRPQQKQQKEKLEIIKNLKIGDKIYTNSGIICFIQEIEIDKDVVKVKIDDNTAMLIYKNSIAGLIS